MSFAVSSEEVQALFDKELKKANENNPPFHSAHEGYAVLLEEVEEVKEELDGLDCYTGYIWDAVKNGGCLRNDLEWTKSMFLRLLERQYKSVQCVKSYFIFSARTKRKKVVTLERIGYDCVDNDDNYT